ncbi:hypothetical protein Tco_1136906 [Tanacetum coccineum]
MLVSLRINLGVLKIDRHGKSTSPGHIADLPEDEPVHPEPDPVIRDHAPMHLEKEEPEEEPEPELEFAPFAQDAPDNMNGTFYVGEGSSAIAFTTDHYKVSTPGPLGKNMDARYSKVKTLTKQMKDRSDIEFWNKKFDPNDDLECSMPIDTPPSPYLVVMGDKMIDLLLRDELDTLSTGDREINFNRSRDIEELERLLANDPIPFPRESEDSISSLDPSCDSSFVAVTDTLIDSDSDLGLDLGLSEIVAPLLSIKKTVICLREVERFDPFFSLTQSGGTTWVMERPSYRFPHMSSPRPAAYSPKEVMYYYYHPHLTTGDGFDHGPKIK